MQPLIVKQKGSRYMISAGERRFRAARLAGLSEVPVLVTDYDEAQIHEVSLIENIQRENLNPIEEAAAIRFLMKQHDMTQEEVAKVMGTTQAVVARLESGRVMPSTRTLQRFAKATKSRLRISFEPAKVQAVIDRKRRTGL